MAKIYPGISIFEKVVPDEFFFSTVSAFKCDIDILYGKKQYFTFRTSQAEQRQSYDCARIITWIKRQQNLKDPGVSSAERELNTAAGDFDFGSHPGHLHSQL